MDAKERTAWFREARWGVCCHYLADAASSRDLPELTAEAWNRRVEAFDTEGLAVQLEEAGAGYLLITVGQNSGFYCAPNETYDAIVGIAPSKCSRRDLVSDLYDALAPRGIRLLAYLPSGGPANDPVATKRLEWEDMRGGGKHRRLVTFQEKWEAVIREWSERWGEKVSGWWIDGCYFAEAMYRHPHAPNFESLAGALRAGNPARILAFNPGVKVPVISLTEHEDYTAGELAHALQVGLWRDGYRPIGGEVDGAQYHVLTFLGAYWGRGAPRFSDALVAGYTDYVNRHGGVVTWDVPISRGGRLPGEYIAQLGTVR